MGGMGGLTWSAAETGNETDMADQHPLGLTAVGTA